MNRHSASYRFIAPPLATIGACRNPRRASGSPLRLIGGGDPELWRIVAPLPRSEPRRGAARLRARACRWVRWSPCGRFPGRRAVIVTLNALLGLPSVVVGLVVYLLLSRAGPLGPLGILFTPTAIVIAQTLLVLPIVAALVAPVRRGRVARVRGAAHLARRLARPRRADAALGPALLAAHRRARWASAAPPPKWAR